MAETEWKTSPLHYAVASGKNQIAFMLGSSLLQGSVTPRAQGLWLRGEQTPTPAALKKSSGLAAAPGVVRICLMPENKRISF